MISQQETYDQILQSITKLAQAKKDTDSLSRISVISTLDRRSADYRKLCYDLASTYGYFNMPYPTPESKQLELYYHSDYGKSNIRNYKAPLLFYRNEKRLNIDTKKILNDIKKMNVKIFGIYGRQDQIFSNKQFADIRQLIGDKRFDLIDNCSHYPFVDQQQRFIDDIDKFMM